ncbi:hypothetical protein BH11BAC2_BH11BAC2_13340 [soil metagenome]
MEMNFLALLNFKAISYLKMLLNQYKKGFL